MQLLSLIKELWNQRQCYCWQLVLNRIVHCAVCWKIEIVAFIILYDSDSNTTSIKPILISNNQFLTLNPILRNLAKTKQTKTELIYTWAMKITTKSLNSLFDILKVHRDYRRCVLPNNLFHHSFPVSCTLNRFTNNFHFITFHFIVQHCFTYWWLVIWVFLLYISVSKGQLIYNYFGEINYFPGNQNFSNSWLTIDAIKKL